MATDPAESDAVLARRRQHGEVIQRVIENLTRRTEERITKLILDGLDPSAFANTFIDQGAAIPSMEEGYWNRYGIPNATFIPSNLSPVLNCRCTFLRLNPDGTPIP